MIINQYPDEVIRTWRTSRLGCLYMNSYTIAITQDAEETSQLARITDILSSRPRKETAEIYRWINRELSVYSPDPEKKALLTGMKNHFYRNVLD